MLGRRLVLRNAFDLVIVKFLIELYAQILCIKYNLLHKSYADNTIKNLNTLQSHPEWR